MDQRYDEELDKLLREIPDEVQSAQHMQQCMSLDVARIMTTSTHLPLNFKPSSEQKSLANMNDYAAYADDHTSSGNLYNTLVHLNVSEQHENLPHVCQFAEPGVASDGILHQALPDHSIEPSVLLHSDSLNTCKGDNMNGIGSRNPPSRVNRSLVSTISDSSIVPRLPSSLQLDEPFSDDRSKLLEQELHSEFRKLSLVQDGIRFLRDMKAPMEAPHLAGQMLLEPSRSYTDAMKMQHGFQQVMKNGTHSSPPYMGMISSYASGSKMMYAQQLHDARHLQQQIEEKVYYNKRIKEELLLRQQKLQEQQARFYASLHNQSGSPYTRNSAGLPSDLNFFQQNPSSKTTLGGVFADQGIPSTQAVWENPVMLAQDVAPSSNVCQYCLHGLCASGDLCATSHSEKTGISVNGHFIVSDNGFSQVRRATCNVEPASHGPMYNPPDAKDLLVSSHSNGYSYSKGTHLPLSNHFNGTNGCAISKSINPGILQHSVNSQLVVSQQQLSPPTPKYTTLKEIEGQIYGIAKDQHGCRFLQKKFEEGIFEDVQKIFEEIIEHVIELMTDPFGNYLVQKLLEVCNEAQLLEILHRVTGKGQLVTISLNMHGTRAVQKLIETLKTSEQMALVISSLKQGVVTLIKDLNGNHVVQRCLQRLSTEDNKFIFIAAASHCVEIATHRHGCCVLQRCVDFSTGQQRECLVAEITANSLILSQDPFGNYVVQYILDLGITWAIADVITRLEGNFAHLAMQKFSSNVVEKCLKLGGEESKAKIIEELISNTRLAQLLQDPFANYVVQSALTVSKGHLYVGLIEAIRPHLPALRSSPYGKRIVSRMSSKK